MKRILVLIISVLAGMLVWSTAFSGEMIRLPLPVSHAQSFEKTLQMRRSVRVFQSNPLTLQQVGQLLWAGQGITSNDSYRNAPSAGGLFPIEIFVVVGNVTGLVPGVYQYDAKLHALKHVQAGDKRAALAKVALNQRVIAEAPIDIVITGVYHRTMKKYRVRGARYVLMECGHVAQNITLQTVSLGLASVPIGAFKDADVVEVLGIPDDHYPLYIIPVGKE